MMCGRLRRGFPAPQQHLAGILRYIQQELRLGALNVLKPASAVCVSSNRSFRVSMLQVRRQRYQREKRTVSMAFLLNAILLPRLAALRCDSSSARRTATLSASRSTSRGMSAKRASSSPVVCQNRSSSRRIMDDTIMHLRVRTPIKNSTAQISNKNMLKAGWYTDAGKLCQIQRTSRTDCPTTFKLSGTMAIPRLRHQHTCTAR